jgi:hypothetical protein
MAPHLTEDDPDALEFGLQIWLDGLERLRRRPRPG